jgi:hypothetical protein
MSSTRQAVVLGPSFTGFGNRPALIPAHHVDLLTGMGPRGARIDASRRKPVVGSSKSFDTDCLRLVEDGAVLRRSIRAEADFGCAQKPETEIGFGRLLVLRRRQ